MAEKSDSFQAERAEARERVRKGFRTWFLTPPRRHGEVLYTREVSFLELFYDLVYVVLIAQVSHHLAQHVGWEGILDFSIVFGLIWFAWFNGTFWHELHARADGRSRNYIFLQMGLLALLAVFAGEATGATGAAFAYTYSLLFILFTWQWYTVQRVDDPRYRPVTMRYLSGMVLTVVLVVISGFLDEIRIWIWGFIVVAWVIAGFLMMTRSRTEGFGEGVTASLVERVGLFTIVVLGEVVVGVVTGIIDAPERSPLIVATGIVGLTIGYGIWWNYFDLLGRRVPDQTGAPLSIWLFAHLPLTMAIAAGGAAMVSLVEHAAYVRTEPGPALLLSSSVAVVLLGITVAVRALPEDEFPSGMAGQIAPTLVLAALTAVLVGLLRPPPIVLVCLLIALLFLTWLRIFILYVAFGGELREEGIGELQ
ncbi:MAG TPA: low temperature requirement protein A [Acidimicrobiia bacterium]|nr:low temperature requirement protein A [Acidimicrobiia bacterium]